MTEDEWSLHIPESRQTLYVGMLQYITAILKQIELYNFTTNMLKAYLSA